MDWPVTNWDAAISISCLCDCILVSMLVSTNLSHMLLIMFYAIDDIRYKQRYVKLINENYCTSSPTFSFVKPVRNIFFGAKWLLTFSGCGFVHLVGNQIPISNLRCNDNLEFFGTCTIIIQTTISQLSDTFSPSFMNVTLCIVDRLYWVNFNFVSHLQPESGPRAIKFAQPDRGEERTGREVFALRHIEAHRV